MLYFARICAHARSWHEFAKCRFAHFPSFFSVHVDTYGMNRSAREGKSVKRFERSSGPDIALYKNYFFFYSLFLSICLSLFLWYPVPFS